MWCDIPRRAVAVMCGRASQSAYFDFDPDDLLPVALVDAAPEETLLPDVTDWLLPLALELLPEFFAVPVSSTLLLPPFLPPWVGLLIIVSLGLTKCGVC
jgi:hypothetical protein